MTLVPYEIGPQYKPGGIALVGRDPGYQEMQEGRPFVEWAPAGSVLKQCMTQAGLRRASVSILNVSREKPKGNAFRAHNRASLEREIAHLHETLQELQPSVIVALGNEACHALIPGWPDAKDAKGNLIHTGNIFGAQDIQNRRGYLFETEHGLVLASTHPAAIAREWTPWSALLVRDLSKAKDIARRGHFSRPRREVTVVSSPERARRAAQALRGAGILAADIEIHDERRLACVGFAGESGAATVFPAEYLAEARVLLESPDVGLVWQNGVFDTYFLWSREGIRCTQNTGDTMIQWHALYPELAGAAQGTKDKRRRTAKSLAFLASLYTYDAWWKDYEFTNQHEMFVLNGRDCCITYDIWKQQEEQIDAMQVREAYERSLALIMPVCDMTQRGMRVDEKLRAERLEKIEQRLESFGQELNEIVLPLLEERWERLSPKEQSLFEHIEGVCECCRHGEAKQKACWSCAGFEKAPSKKEMEERFGNPDGLKKDELEARVLGTCKVCNGAPRKEWREYNPRSNDQTKLILYEILKLPKRYNGGSLTTDETALKDLLGKVQ